LEILLITNGYIVIPNKILIDGAIYVEGNIIKDIGNSEDIIKKHSADTTINANKMLVLPGLINSHIHASATLYRGIGDDMSLMEENKRVMFPIEISMTEEDSYWGTMLACVELIKSGTTCMADHYINMNGSAKAVYHTGMRAVLATAMMDQWDKNENAPPGSTGQSKADIPLISTYHQHAQYL
jgi:5-methylthioadenosine/S-adenosylhomocysteine deaminase